MKCLVGCMTMKGKGVSILFKASLFGHLVSGSQKAIVRKSSSPPSSRCNLGRNLFPRDRKKDSGLGGPRKNEIKCPFRHGPEA